MNDSEHRRSRLGLLFGVGAYGLWGVIPLYFRALRHLPPLEVLAHRVVWSFVLLLAVVVVLRKVSGLRAALQSPGVLWRLGASTTLIAINWFTYIYAVKTDRVLESSLGYFVTPLANVLLGMAFLGERLRPVQLLSLMLAAAAVVNLAVQGGAFPWIALVLAVSFAWYGFLRKTVAVEATLGLFVETALLTVPALAVLATLQTTGRAEAWEAGPATVRLLLLGGVVTTIPLLLFAGAARRLRMATLGFLQYLAPSIQFALAVTAFGEPFSRTQLASFTLIWTAVLLYSIDSIRSYRAARPRTRTPRPAPEPSLVQQAET